MTSGRLKACLGAAWAGMILMLTLNAAVPVKVKTIVDEASLKANPEIGARSVIKLPLDTVLDVQEKRGEWFKVSLDRDGQKVEGFIHEMLVEEVSEGPSSRAEEPVAAGTEPEPDPAAEIESRVEESKDLIRQEKNLDAAIDSLNSLIAQVFRVADAKRQRILTVEIFLWMGVARVAQGDDYAAVKEFEKMFTVDAAAAREATRNISAPRVVGLLKLAEQVSQGLPVDFSLEVVTEPPGATVLFNGQEMGISPAVFHASFPKLVVEIKKTGYKPLKEEVFLSAFSARKDYTLELIRRTLSITSDPPGASVVVDGKPSGHTNVSVDGLSYGRHEVRLQKENHLEWTGVIDISEEEEPSLRAALIGSSYVSLSRWGDKGSGLLDSPVSLAGDRAGSFYVLDQSSVRIKKFDEKGRPATEWKAQAPELQELRGPSSIVVSPGGALWLADIKRNVILRLDAQGQRATKWTGQGGGTSEFRMPADLAFDSVGNVYIVDAGNGRVKKYSAQGEFLKFWGGPGTAEGKFQSPRAVAVNARDEVFVLDESRVQKFTQEGQFLAGWGTKGTADSQFLNPQGLAVDPAGCVYVADTDNHRLQKFDEDGVFIVKWGTKGREQGQFNQPVDVWTEGLERVYVVERENDRVQVFIVGQAPSARRTRQGGLGRSAGE